jgi:hypothetical protein
MNGISIKSSVVLCIILMAISLTGCSKDDTIAGNDKITGSGRLVSQTRVVGTFSGIQVTNFAKVFITQDTLESLRIEVDDNIMDRVNTSVAGGILSVGLKDGSYNGVTVNVYASMKTIKRLESMGAADFSNTVPIVTDTIVCRIIGAGTITLTGSAVYEAAEIVGAGTIKNFGLSTSRCSASISGTGNIEVNVSGQLDALITGTGAIIYDGNPSTVHPVVSGVGSIQQKR